VDWTLSPPCQGLRQAPGGQRSSRGIGRAAALLARLFPPLAHHARLLLCSGHGGSFLSHQV